MAMMTTFMRLPIRDANEPRATARGGVHVGGSEFSTIVYTGIDHERTRRYEKHHRKGVGFRSTFHPKVLDYRTVDELGPRGLPEKLDLERLPRTKAAKRLAAERVDEMFVEAADFYASADTDRRATFLHSGVPAVGEIRPLAHKVDTQYCYFKIDVLPRPRAAHTHDAQDPSAASMPSAPLRSLLHCACCGCRCPSRSSSRSGSPCASEPRTLID